MAHESEGVLEIIMDIRGLKVFRPVHMYMAFDSAYQLGYPEGCMFKILDQFAGTQDIFKPGKEIDEGIFTGMCTYFLKLGSRKIELHECFQHIHCCQEPVFSSHSNMASSISIRRSKDSLIVLDSSSFGFNQLPDMVQLCETDIALNQIFCQLIILRQPLIQFVRYTVNGSSQLLISCAIPAASNPSEFTFRVATVSWRMTLPARSYIR